MNKYSPYLISIICLVILSCGPSAESMARKSCELHEKFFQAQANKDSSEMFRLTAEIGNMENKLQNEYMYKNPEWLLKYVKLRDKCLIEKKIITPEQNVNTQGGN